MIIIHDQEEEEEARWRSGRTTGTRKSLKVKNVPQMAIVYKRQNL